MNANTMQINAVLYSTISSPKSFVPVLRAMLSATLDEQISQTVSAFNCALPNDELSLIFVCHKTNLPLDDNDATIFKYLNLRLVQHSASQYYRAISQTVHRHDHNTGIIYLSIY
jgi:hypothetical protein